MNQIILRFPVIAEQIFDQLDDQNLAKCRGTSKIWYDATERLKCTRKIQRLSKENTKHQTSWKLVLLKIPTEVLKKLALACEEYHYNILQWPDGVESSPLHIATCSGDLQLFKHILEKAKDKNPKDHFGQTPFHTAASHGSLEIFEFIMERAEDKNPKFKHGWTTLHYAAAGGHLEICKFICKSGLNLNSRTEIGMTPLLEAAIEGYLEICKLLVLKVEDKNPSNKYGFTPLHAAAHNGYLQIYEFIAERVENKNPEDVYGRTPLSLAKRKEAKSFCHYQICRLIRSFNKEQRNPNLSNPEKNRRKKN